MSGGSDMGRPLAGLLLAFLGLSGTTVSAEVIWRGDFETGDTSQWKAAPKDGVTVVNDPVCEGKYALCTRTREKSWPNRCSMCCRNAGWSDLPGPRRLARGRPG